MSWTLLAVAVAAAGGAAAGASAPTVIGRLRQPVAAEATPAEAKRAESSPTEPSPTDSSPADPSLADVARTPQLGRRLAVTGLLLGGVVGGGVGWQPELAAWTYLAAVCLILGYVDARTRLLPTQVIAPSYGVVVALLFTAGIVDGQRDDLVRAGLGWLVMGGLYLLLWLLAPRSLGYGDVRLSGLLALCLGYRGWGELVTGLYAGFLLGGLFSLLLLLSRRARRGTHFPFGPFMMLGAVVALLWGATLSDWYVAR